MLADVEAATARLIDTAARMSDDDVRAPSALPGWTRGHVLAHIARNADGLRNLLVWARTGIETPQYASKAARDHEIQAGAPRPLTDQLADLRESARRFAEEAACLTTANWQATVRAFTGFPHPAWYTLRRRLSEVEVHHVDLMAGYTVDDWPDAFVHDSLIETLAALKARQDFPVGVVRATDTGLVVTVGVGPEISGSEHDLLGWLAGRADGGRLVVRPAQPLPVPSPWPLPYVPPEGGDR